MPERVPIGHISRKEHATMADLSSIYLGLALRNPLVASASPLSESPERAPTT